LLETTTHNTTPSEGATPIPYTTPCLKVLKSPKWKEPPLKKLGGVFSRPVYIAERAGAETIKCAVINIYDPGGAILDTNTALAPTKGTASIKLASGAVKATTTKPKALEPKGESTVWCMLKMLPSPLSQKDLGKSRMLL